MSKKYVSFDSNITIYEKEMEDYCLPYSVHEVEIRKKGECFHACQPKDELIKFKQIVSQCLQHKMSIIFGNLGRHIHLLEYFLDLAFDESIAIYSDWELNSPYQYSFVSNCPNDYNCVNKINSTSSNKINSTSDNKINSTSDNKINSTNDNKINSTSDNKINSTSDNKINSTSSSNKINSTFSNERLKILFIIEPHFGKIIKPEFFNAENIIILSSHLSIGISAFTCFYHIGYQKYYKPRGKTKHMITFVPPTFYDPSWNKPEGDHICLDLTKCSSPSEAFLKLLSGKEMIFPNTYTVDIPQHIQNHLEKQIMKNTLMFTHPKLKYLYFI